MRNRGRPGRALADRHARRLPFSRRKRFDLPLYPAEALVAVGSVFASRKNFHQRQRSSRFSSLPASPKSTKTKTMISSNNAKVSEAL